jgi:small-conductance mechanosensitive channel
MLWEKFLEYAPSIFSALVLLVLGYYVSKLIFKAISKTLEKLGLNKLGKKIGLAELLITWKLNPNLAHITARLVSTFVFLLFIMSAADALKMQALTHAIDQFMLYLPSILGAFIIFLLSSAAGHYIRTAILKATESMNIKLGAPLANFAYYSLLLIGGLLALEQLKIETNFLTQMIQIIAICAGVAISLSLGLGTRDVSKNLIAGLYLKDSLTVGKLIKVGDREGRLLQVTPVAFVLEMENGSKILFPNSKLLDCEIIQK